MNFDDVERCTPHAAGVCTVTSNSPRALCALVVLSRNRLYYQEIAFILHNRSRNQKGCVVRTNERSSSWQLSQTKNLHVQQSIIRIMHMWRPCMILLLLAYFHVFEVVLAAEIQLRSKFTSGPKAGSVFITNVNGTDLTVTANGSSVDVIRSINEIQVMQYTTDNGPESDLPVYILTWTGHKCCGVCGQVNVNASTFTFCGYNDHGASFAGN